MHRSKMNHQRCVYINNRCTYQLITQQYLKQVFNETMIVTTCFGLLQPLSGFNGQTSAGVPHRTAASTHT